MGFGVESNTIKIYNDYIKTHPECSVLTTDAVWLRMKEEGEITQEQYNAIKKGIIFDFKTSQQNPDDWKSLLGLDTKPQTKTNYVEKKSTHKFAKELELDYKGKIDKKQFELSTLREKYNSKMYNISYEKNSWGLEKINISSKNDSNSFIEITKTPYGEINYFEKKLNSMVYYTVNNGDLSRSQKGKDPDNCVDISYSNGKILSESFKKDGITTQNKYYENGKLAWQAFYNMPEGDYRLDYKNGKITQKYILSGPDEDVYYIYENGKPVKKMFATTKQSYAVEGDVDSVIEDYEFTEKIDKISRELHDDIYAKNKLGLPTTRPSLSQHVMNIKADEVEAVMQKYEEANGENLLDAIENEIGMDYNECVKIHNHLEKLYVENGDMWKTGKYIGKKLTKYKGIEAISAKEFERYIKLINPQNVIGVLRNFDTPKIMGEDIRGILGKFNIEVYDYQYLFSYTGLIQEIMNKGGLDNRQKKELVEHVLTQLDKSADNNSNWIYIKDIVKSTRKNLNEGKSLKKDSLRLQIRAQNSLHGGEKEENKANGKFDLDFRQGGTGDCWLLAGIISIIQKPAGKKALESSIRVDNDGNVTVNMKGAGKVYKISAKEIEESVHLSKGDADIRAIEIAMDRYIQENSLIHSSIDGNRSSTFYNAFFGNGHKNSYSEDFNNPNKFYSLSITFGFSAINKAGEEVKVSGKHEIAIVGSDSEYVHVIDPNQGTNEPLRISWNKFRLMYAQLNSIDVCELPE